MFERFTGRARQVVVLAQDEARGLRHNYIGTEHLLLGLLREKDGVACRVLVSLGISGEVVRSRVVDIVGEGEGEVVRAGQIPFTPRAKKVLELALREGVSLGHNYIGTEHILLGIARENDGVAARILLELGLDAERIRSEVASMLGMPGGFGPRPMHPGMRRGMGRHLRRLQRRIEHLEDGPAHDPQGRAYRKLDAARDAALDAGDYELARKLLELEIEARERAKGSPPADESSAAEA